MKVRLFIFFIESFEPAKTWHNNLNSDPISLYTGQQKIVSYLRSQYEKEGDGDEESGGIGKEVNWEEDSYGISEKGEERSGGSFPLVSGLLDKATTKVADETMGLMIHEASRFRCNTKESVQTGFRL